MNLNGLGGVAPGQIAFQPTGEIVLFTLIRPDGTVTGTTYLWNQCLGQPLPTAPPDVQSLLEVADLPRLAVTTNPPNGGLVGLENWFWYEGPTAVPVQVTLNGWTATAQATATGFEWGFGDGTSAAADHPGTAEEPAVRHVFTTKGTRPLTLTITWTATFTLQGFGTVVQAPLGTATITGPATAYAVQEREAVIVG